MSLGDVQVQQTASERTVTSHHAACVSTYVLHEDGSEGDGSESASVSDGAFRCIRDDECLYTFQLSVCGGAAEVDHEEKG